MTPSGKKARSPRDSVFTSGLRQRLELVRHLIEFGPQTIVVRGPVSSGRSFFLRMIALEAQPHWAVVAINGAQISGAKQLLSELLTGLGGERDLDVTSPEKGLEAQVIQRLALLRQRDQIPLLIVDDCDQMSALIVEFVTRITEFGRPGDNLRTVLGCSVDSDFIAHVAAISTAGSLPHLVDLSPVDERAEPANWNTPWAGLDEKEVHDTWDAPWSGHGPPPKPPSAPDSEQQKVSDQPDTPTFLPQATQLAAAALGRWRTSIANSRKLVGGIVVVFAALALLAIGVSLQRENVAEQPSTVLELTLPVLDSARTVTGSAAPRSQTATATAPPPLLSVPKVPANGAEGGRNVVSKATRDAAQFGQGDPAISSGEQPVTGASESERSPSIGRNVDDRIIAHKDWGLIRNPATYGVQLFTAGSQQEDVPTAAPGALQTDQGALDIGAGRASHAHAPVAIRPKPAGRKQNVSAVPDTVATKQSAPRVLIAVQPDSSGAVQVVPVMPDTATSKQSATTVLAAVPPKVPEVLQPAQTVPDTRPTELVADTIPIPSSPDLPRVPPIASVATEKSSLERPPVSAAESVSSLSTSRDSEISSAYNSKWLLTQKSSNYVIQLFGTSQRPNAEKFLREHELSKQAAIFELEHADKPWYVAVTGLYPDRASALNAISALDRSLFGSKPWPRSIGSLHK